MSPASESSSGERLKLLAAARDGDPEALTILLDSDRDYLIQIAVAELNSDIQPKGLESAIVEETLLEARQSLPGFRGNSQQEWHQWLQDRLKNKVANQLRNSVEAETCSILTGVAGVDTNEGDHPPETVSLVGASQITPPDDFVVDTDVPVTPRTYAGYQVEAILGRGGFGVVYKARDTQLGRSVAIKVPLPSVIANELLRGRFELEARASAALRHPNIVIVHDTISGSQPAIIYEYCNGGTLSDFAKDHSDPLPQSLIIDIAICVAGALRHAHAHGVLHRDLKPGNILLTDTGNEQRANGFCVNGKWWVPKLCDFGLAKLVDENSEMTQTNIIIGSVNYMAPEQASGNSRDSGTYTDIFSFGSVLYWMITGKPPFKAESRVVSLTQIETKDPDSPKSIRTDISRDLESVCLKCLQKAPDDRYESATALLNDLLAIRSGEPISIRPASVMQRMRLWYRNHHTLALSLAVVFTLTACGLVIQELHNRAQQQLIAELDEINTRLEDVVDNERDARLKIELSQQELQKLHHVSVLRNAGSLMELGQNDQARQRLERHRSGNESTDPEEFAYRFVRASGNTALSPLTEHQTDVLSSAVDEDRNLLATGDKLGEIVLRTTDTGQMIRVLDAFPGEICDLEFSADGTLLAASGTRDLIRLYDTQTWKPVRELKQHDGTVTAIVFTPDGRRLISGSRDHHLFIWNTEDWTVERKILAHDTVQHISLSRDGRFLASGGSDGHTKVWDVESGEKVSDFSGHRNPVLSTTLSDNGRFVAAGGYGSYVIVWDRSDNSEYAVIGVRQALSIRFLSTSSLLAIANADGEIKTFDLSQGEPRLIRTIKAHSGRIRSFETLQHPPRLVTASDDDTVRMTRGPIGRLGTRYPVEKTRFVTINPKGDKIAIGQFTGLISLLNREGRIEGQETIDGQHSAAVQYAPDGQLTAAVIQGNAVRLIHDALGEDPTELMLQHELGVLSVYFSHNADLVATVTDDHVLRIWQATDGSLVSQHKFERIYDTSFSPDNRSLAVATNHRRILEINLVTGTTQDLLTIPETDPFVVRHDPTGRYLATGGFTGHVTLWDRDKSETVAEFIVPDEVYCLGFSPDGKTLVTATTDVRLFDVASRQHFMTFGKTSYPGERYACLTFSQQGDCLVAAHDSPEGSILQIWDTARASTPGESVHNALAAP